MTTTQDSFNINDIMTNLNTGNDTNINAAPNLQPKPQYHHYQQEEQKQPSQSFADVHNQLVVATQQSNPYYIAGGVGPRQASDQLNSSFVVPPPTRSSTASAASFDPFASPQQQQQSFLVSQQQYQTPFLHSPPPSQKLSVQVPPQQQQKQYQAPPSLLQGSQQFSAVTDTNIIHAQDPQQNHQYQEQQSPDFNINYGNSNRSLVSAPPSTVVVRDDDDDHSNSTGNYNLQNSENLSNPYSNALALQVQGSNCSGLPKGELVGKRGFVLSRISFRTIVMKKWKQSFWVQYGGHTMLWFRSQVDFDDWLNNPYHNQMQRNFLIKLAVNFVHDLYKPNVRGYQVTQCRTKPYGKNKVVRQFKLERWMDYGPTIAAAFGSYDPKEVDACREAIVECMKNTPLDNGIRATGAVKEHHDQQQRVEEEQELQKLRQQKLQEQKSADSSNVYQNYRLDNNYGRSGRVQSMVAPVVDLLGDNNVSVGFDDSASLPARTPDLLFGNMSNGALVSAANQDAAYSGVPPPSNYNPLTSQLAMHQTQQLVYPPQSQPSPVTYGAPSSQEYLQDPSQHQQHQKADYAGYPQQLQQQAGPPAAYPQPP